MLLWDKHINRPPSIYFEPQMQLKNHNLFGLLKGLATEGYVNTWAYTFGRVAGHFSSKGDAFYPDKILV